VEVSREEGNWEM